MKKLGISKKRKKTQSVVHDGRLLTMGKIQDSIMSLTKTGKWYDVVFSFKGDRGDILIDELRIHEVPTCDKSGVIGLRIHYDKRKGVRKD